MGLVRRAALIGAAVAAAALVCAAAAAAADQPKGEELRQTYPLQPKASAAPSRAPAPTPAAGRRPASAENGGGSAAPIAGAAIVLVAAGASVLLWRRRRAAAASRPASLAAERTRAAPSPAAPSPATVPGGTPTAASRVANGTPAEAPGRAARGTPAAANGMPTAAPPATAAGAANRAWPAGSERLWRCEVRAEGALSGRFRAVVYPPGGGPGSVLAAAPTPRATGDWQSAAPLEAAVGALVTELEAEGWEPVDGDDRYVRRFCWRRAEPPHTEEDPWKQ